MILKPQRDLFILVLMLILVGQPVDADQSSPVLKVGISPFSPFVILSKICHIVLTPSRHGIHFPQLSLCVNSIK